MHAKCIGLNDLSLVTATFSSAPTARFRHALCHVTQAVLCSLAYRVSSIKKLDEYRVLKLEFRALTE